MKALQRWCRPCKNHQASPREPEAGPNKAKIDKKLIEIDQSLENIQNFRDFVDIAKRLRLMAAIQLI